VRRVVGIRLDDIVGSVDDVRSRLGTDSVADSGDSGYVGVARSLRNKGRTSEFSIVELVDHQGLESVGNWVDVIDPSRPAQHVGGRNSEASVHDETEDDDGGRGQGLHECSRGGSDRSEEHRHHESSEETDQEEEEEWS
jgi:hypothetical protein